MTFDEWLTEIENYSLRVERLYDDIDTLTGVDKTLSEQIRNRGIILNWLKAAYEVGREHEYEKNLEENGGTL